MKHYHYLAAGLPELVPGQSGKPVTTADFLKTCSELLTPDDFDKLKKLFLWNDMKNLLRYKKMGDPYLSPAYYDETEFNEFLDGTGDLLPFLGRALADRESGQPDFPGFSDIDNVASHLFGNLGELNSRFLADYFSFELELRNILSVLSLNRIGRSFEGKLIPFGKTFEIVTEKNRPAEDLFLEFPFARKLEEAFGTSDPAALEKEIDSVRWTWLEEYPCAGDNVFSADAILIYNLKLGIMNRWAALDAKQGRKMFDDLVGIIRRSIRFSIEFSTAGEQRQ